MEELFQKLTISEKEEQPCKEQTPKKIIIR
jgi:hypothetical protein